MLGMGTGFILNQRRVEKRAREQLCCMFIDENIIIKRKSIFKISMNSEVQSCSVSLQASYSLSLPVIVRWYDFLYFPLVEHDVFGKIVTLVLSDVEVQLKLCENSFSFDSLIKGVQACSLKQVVRCH